MASKSLRRFDVQAKVSLIVSILGGLGVVFLLVMLLRNFDSRLGAVIYGKNSIYGPVYLMACAITMLLSATGLVMGFNSAGQRRNDMQNRSWAAFFLGTAVLAIAIVCFAMFWFLKLKF